MNTTASFDSLSRRNVEFDAIERPAHYNKHPSKVEAIEVIEHFMGNLFNAVKYVYRRGEKGSELDDLGKARWYFERELARLRSSRAATTFWDGPWWREPAARVVFVDKSVLGLVLLELLKTPAITIHAALENCVTHVEGEIARLKDERASDHPEFGKASLE